MRFALSGAAATLLHVTTASTLIAWGSASPMLANGVAFIMATGCSYLLNTLWSFSSRLHRKNLARFLVVSALALILTVLISWAVQATGGSYWIGLLVIVMVVTPFSFLMHKLWTYR